MLKRNLIANYVGYGWSAAMSLAFIPLYIKYLGMEAYGLIGLFAVLAAWFNLLDMGMTPTLSREMARFTGGERSVQSIRDLLRTIEILAACVALLAAGCIAWASDWIATSWLRADNLPVSVVTEALLIMAFVTALRFIEGVYRSSIIGLQRQVTYNLINSGTATFRWLGAVGVLAWVSPTIQGFFYWQGIASIITLFVLSMATYSCLPPAPKSGRFSIEELRGVWHFAGGVFGITLIAMFLSQIDKIILARLLSLSDYGYYALAATVATSLAIVYQPIHQAIIPRLNQLYAVEDHESLVATYHLGAQLLTVVIGSAAMTLIVFSDEVLFLWTNDRAIVESAGNILAVLTLARLLNSMMTMPYEMQLVKGQTRLVVIINAVAALILLPAIIWATINFGAVGAAWVSVILNSGYLLVGAHAMYRSALPTEKMRWYRDDIISPLLSSFLIAAACKLMLPELTSFSHRLLSLIAVFTCTLIAACLAAPRLSKLLYGRIMALYTNRPTNV